MRNCGLVGLVWLILGGAGQAAAENLGGTEVEVRQGNLSRWSVWWNPEGTEGRFWWDPEAGGAAWLRVGEFQFGPLKTVSGPEGTRTWGPGSRQTGAWGAAWTGKAAGVWAVQRAEAFEAGLEAGWPGPRGSAGVGGSRTWTLGPADGGPRWTDTGFAGGTWDGGPWKAGAEVRGALVDLGEPNGEFRARLSVRGGPWVAEARGAASTSAPWAGRATLGWETSPWSLGAWWDRTEGTSAQAKFEEAAWGLVWETNAEVGSQDGVGSGKGGFSVSGKAGPGWWDLGWSAGPGWSPVVQKVTARWRQSGLEASVDWTVEGLRLGWFGPGSRLAAKLRFLF